MSDHDDEGGGHGDEELWLVSYADMMTLLFGFFVLMYTFAMAKLEKIPFEVNQDWIHLRKEVARYFGGDYIEPFDKVAKEFKISVTGSAIENLVDITQSPEGLKISFQSQALFESGDATLAPAITNSLVKLANLVGEDKSNYVVRVEGHTDDVPIGKSAIKYPSNWELSGARAASVVRVFETQNFNPAKLTAIGYGQSRPIVPNLDENGTPIPENRAKNRRIEITIAMIDTAPATGTPDKSLPPKGDNDEQDKN